LDTAAQLARYIVLAGGGGADLEAHGGGILVKALEAQDAGAIHNGLRPGRIAAQLGRCGFQSLQGLFLGELRREGDVHEGLRPVAAEIRDRADVAIRKGDERAAGIADHGPAQGDVFDASDRIADLNRVTDDELIFQNDVHAGDEIAHQILRPKADRQAGQAGERGRGQYVDPKLRGGGQQRHAPDDFAARAVKDHRDRARLLLAGLCRACLGAGRLDQQVGDQPQQAVDHQRHNEYGHQTKEDCHAGIREIREETGHRIG